MTDEAKTIRAEQVTRALLGGLALVLAGAGQMAWWATPKGLWLGLALSALSMVLFVFGGLRRPPALLIRGVARGSLSMTAMRVGLAGALALLTVITDIAWANFGQTNYLLVLLLWGGAALAYVTAFVELSLEAPNWRAWLRAHRAEIARVSLITLAAAVLRFYQLGAIPRIIDGDEGRIGQFALLTALNPSANPFVLVENFGSLYLQAINASLTLFGHSAFALRLLPAIGGVLAVPALYVLGRQLFGARVAFWAAGLLAFSHAHLHFSRIASVAYIHGTWLAPLELYFFFRGLQKRSAWQMALGGVLLGAHFSIYITAQIIAPLLLVYWLVALALRLPLAQRSARLVGIFWSGALLTASPLAVYAAQQPGEFFARLNADGTFQSGWLAQTMAATGQSAAAILAERVTHAFLSLSFYPAIDFYGAGVPLLNVITSTLFVLGMAAALWQTRAPHHLLLNGYFWAITVAVGVFSIPPSADSYRMLAAFPAAILLAALGLDTVLGLLLGDEPQRAPLRAAGATLVLLAVLALGVRTYYNDFALRCKYGGDPQTRFASYLGAYLQTMDRDATVYLLSDDAFRYGTHGSVDFLSGNFPVLNVPEPVATLPHTPGLVILAAPSRISELQAWAVEHTDGQLRTIRDCENVILAAYSFVK